MEEITRPTAIRKDEEGSELGKTKTPMENEECKAIHRNTVTTE